MSTAGPINSPSYLNIDHTFRTFDGRLRDERLAFWGRWSKKFLHSLMIGLNDSQEFKKIRGQMEAAKLEKCESQVDYLLRLLVDERAEKKADNNLKILPIDRKR